MEVAGQSLKETFKEATSQAIEFIWDVRRKLGILPMDNEGELKARLRREIYRWSNTLKNKKGEGVAVTDYLNPEKNPVFLIAKTLNEIGVENMRVSEDVDKPLAELTGLREAWIRELRNRWLYNERLRRRREKSAVDSHALKSQTPTIKGEEGEKTKLSGLSGIELLKEVLALLSESEIKELNLEDGSIKIRISFK